MPRVIILGLALLAVAPVIACRDGGASEPSSLESDFSTPESAILSLEAAYRAKDIEAAVRCKDFRIEARLMLENLRPAPHPKPDIEMIEETARALEESYRHFTAAGFPDFDGVTATFGEKVEQSPGIVRVTEVLRLRNGQTEICKHLVAETPGGWRVLNPVE